MAPILLRSSSLIQDLITQPSRTTSSVITYFSLYPCYSGLDKLLFKPNRLSHSWEKKKHHTYPHVLSNLSLPLSDIYSLCGTSHTQSVIY